MMKNDWMDAFGKADPSFVNAVQRTLGELQKNEEEPIMRKKMRASVAFAIVGCVLAAAVAFAAASRLGVLDFIVGRYVEDVHVLPEATAIIEKDIEQTGGHTSHADFRVRQAVFDGQYAYIVVAVTPSFDRALLLGIDSDPSCPVSDFGPRFENESISIAEYAAQAGMTRLVHTSLNALDDGGIEINSFDYMLEEDGTLVYMLIGENRSDARTAAVTLRCLSKNILATDGATDVGKQETATLSFTLQAADAMGKAVSNAPVEFADCGVCVDSVRLTATPMAVYTEIYFHILDADVYAAAEDGLWFEFLDENGAAMEGGATASGSISAVDEQATQFVQKGSLGAMERLPSQVTLRSYNCWSKDRYQAHTISMDTSEE